MTSRSPASERLALIDSAPPIEEMHKIPPVDLPLGWCLYPFEQESRDVTNSILQNLR